MPIPDSLDRPLTLRDVIEIVRVMENAPDDETPAAELLERHFAGSAPDPAADVDAPATIAEVDRG